MGLNRQPQNTTFVPAMSMSTKTVKLSSGHIPKFKPTSTVMSSVSMKMGGNANESSSKIVTKVGAAKKGSSYLTSTKPAFSTLNVR